MRGAKRVGASARGGCCHAPLSNDTTRRREEDACCLIVYKVTIKVLLFTIIVMLLLTTIFFLLLLTIALYTAVLLLEEVWWQVSLRTASQAPPWHVFDTGNKKTSAGESKHPPSFFHGRARQSHLSERGGADGRK